MYIKLKEKLYYILKKSSSPQNALQDFKQHWFVVSAVSAFQHWSFIHFENEASFFQTFKHVETPPAVKQNLWANLMKPLKPLGSLLHLKILVLCTYRKCVASCQRHPIRGMLWSTHFVRVAWKRGEGKTCRNTMTQDQVLSFWLRRTCTHQNYTIWLYKSQESMSSLSRLWCSPSKRRAEQRQQSVCL